MLLWADDETDWAKTSSLFTAWFSKVNDAVGAATALTSGGCLIRYYTDSAHNLNEATKALWAIARRAILELSPLDLRKG